MKQLLGCLALAGLAGCSLKVEEPLRVRVENPLLVVTPSPQDRSQSAIRNQPIGAAVPYAQAVAEVGEALDRSLKSHGIRRMPMAVSPFWDLNAPAHRETFGRELGEYFIHELESRGYNLLDHPALAVDASGGKPTTKQLKALYNDHRISYLVTGSYSAHPEQVVIQARIIDTNTLQVVASGLSSVPTTELEGGLAGYNPLSGKRGLIVENGGVPEDGQ